MKVFKIERPDTGDGSHIAMSHYDLCWRWRFSKVGDPFFQGEVGDYFSAKLKEKGGFTPEISKQIG